MKLQKLLNQFLPEDYSNIVCDYKYGSIDDWKRIFSKCLHQIKIKVVNYEFLSRSFYYTAEHNRLVLDITLDSIKLIRSAGYDFKHDYIVQTLADSSCGFLKQSIWQFKNFGIIDDQFKSYIKRKVLMDNLVYISSEEMKKRVNDKVQELILDMREYRRNNI